MITRIIDDHLLGHLLAGLTKQALARFQLLQLPLQVVVNLGFSDTQNIVDLKFSDAQEISSEHCHQDKDFLHVMSSFCFRYMVVSFDNIKGYYYD